MTALIYQPDKNAMQSGRAKTRKWVLEYLPSGHRALDPLTGWTGSDDMQAQIRLEFATQADAVRYAKSHGIEYQVIEKSARVRKSKAYSDNFAAGRRQSWTH